MGRLILGIESSCDETSAAVVKDGWQVLSNIISSQIEVHQLYGGVVPELASREHLARISSVVERALSEAGVPLSDLDAIAVANGPGLVGALLVGVSYAKGLAYATGLPLVPVNHIEAHIYANFLSPSPPPLPLLCLVVSGGHTSLILMRDHGVHELLGQTRDDAAGEAFDKIARVLGLPYPGGPHLDKLAQEGRVLYSYPQARLEEGSFDFSFSGLKSAVLNHLNTAAQKGESPPGKDVAASFQHAVVEVLVEKAIRASRSCGAASLCLAGGVSANSQLRKRLQEEAALHSIPVFIPPFAYCTDNAAMIGSLGYRRYLAGIRAGLDLNAHAAMPVANWAEKVRTDPASGGM